MPTILDQIRDEIARRGLTQYRISKDTGLPQGMLSEFLAGKRTPGGEYLAVLCDYLGLELQPRVSLPAKKTPRKPAAKKAPKKRPPA